MSIKVVDKTLPNKNNTEDIIFKYQYFSEPDSKFLITIKSILSINYKEFLKWTKK